MARRFTKEELDSIIEDYNNGMIPKDLGEKYGRNPSSIIHKLKDMDIYHNTKYYYTDDDINFIKEHYPIGDFESIFNKFPNMNKSKLISICYQYGISADYYNNAKWTNEDLNVVKLCYYTHTLEEIRDMIGNRHTCDAIQTKALKYFGYSKDKTWTEEENDILRRYYSIEEVDDVAKRLPNRTRTAIVAHAKALNVLGLRSTKTWWTDEQVEYLKYHWSDKSDVELSDIIGKDVRSIKDKRLRLGLCRVKHFNEASYIDIKKFLRGHLSEWKSRSMENCNYQCVLTGSKDFQIHHLYSFGLIVNDIFEENNFQIKDSLSDYTVDELENIVDACLKKHDEHPLGVCVRTDIHDSFHKKYGKVVLPEMWYKFVSDFNIKDY